jgi:DNA repair protein RadC
MILLGEAKQIKVTAPSQVAAVFGDLLALEDKIARETEHFYVMHLDARHTVKLVELVCIGILDSATIHARETFRRAIIDGSAAIIIAHNHPSGDVNPSDNDIRTTHKLREAGVVLGIPLLDHIVFSPTKYYTFTGNATRNMEEGEVST